MVSLHIKSDWHRMLLKKLWKFKKIQLYCLYSVGVPITRPRTHCSNQCHEKVWFVLFSNVCEKPLCWDVLVDIKYLKVNL